MREVAIVSPVRTAVGNFGGGLKDIPAAELGATVIKAVLERTGLEPDKIDEVILGHGYPSGEEPALGRLCALKAAYPLKSQAINWIDAVRPACSRFSMPA
jgi:acetyl-CoA C-acetyltransferase